MQRLLTIIAALVLALPALASDSNIVRAYHLDRSGIGSSNLCDTSIGCPTIGIWFDDAVAGTYTAEIGGQVLTVNGNPTRISGPTHPAGFSAASGYTWRLDGTGDYLSLADAGGAFASQTAWSVSCVVTPRAGFASGDVLAAKWNTTGDKRSWRLYTGGTSAVLDISSDGTAGTITTLTKAASLALHRLSWVTASCDGAGNCSLWVDEMAVATSAAMGDPFEGDAALTIGADAEAAGDGPVDFAPCAYYDGALVAADHLRLARRYRGLYDGSGLQVVSFTAATPPAIQVAAPADGVTPLLVEMPAGSGMLGETASCVGVYGASAITNKCWRSSLETWAAGAPTGWTEALTSDGNCEGVALSPAHGSYVAACSTTDADDAVTLTSGCATVTGGTAMRLMAWAKTGSGAGLLDVNIIEDDSADCGSPTTTTSVINDQVPGAAWAKYSGNITLQAGTIRAQVQISLPAAAAQVTYIDALQFRAGSLASDAYCGADTDADAVCATSIPSHASAFSANGSQTVEFTGCTPYAAADLAAATYLWHDYSAATNQIMLRLLTTTDEPTWRVYDKDSGYLEVNPSTATNWLANTQYKIRAYMSGLGGLGITWPVGTWVTATTGAGTGIRSAATTATYLGSSNAAPGDAWITGLTYYRGWLR